MTPSAFSVAILAGGRSRRMGTDKALLPLAGKPLIEHVLAATRPLNVPHLLIADTPALDYLELERHPDLIPDQGPLGGLCTALVKTTTPAVLLVACDLPFVTTEFLRFITTHLSTYQALVPSNAHGPHPLCAVYARSCLPLAEQALQAQRLRLRAFVESVDVRYLAPHEWASFDPHHKLLANLNTPEEYHYYQKQ